MATKKPKQPKRSKREPNLEFSVNGEFVKMTYVVWEKQLKKWREKTFVFHKDYLEDVQLVFSKSYATYSGHFYGDNGYVSELIFYLNLDISHIGYSMFYLDNICPYVCYVEDNFKNRFIVVEKNAKRILNIREESMYITDNYNDALSKMLEHRRNDDTQFRLPQQELNFEYFEDYVVMTFTMLHSRERVISSTDYYYLFHKDYVAEFTNEKLCSMDVGYKYKDDIIFKDGSRALVGTSAGFMFRDKEKNYCIQNLKNICSYIAITEDGFVVVPKGDWEVYKIDKHSTVYDNLEDAIAKLESL